MWLSSWDYEHDRRHRRRFLPDVFPELDHSAPLGAIHCRLRGVDEEKGIGWARLERSDEIVSGYMMIGDDWGSSALELNRQLSGCFVDREPRVGRTDEEEFYENAGVKPSWFRVSGPPYSLINSFSVRTSRGCIFQPNITIEEGLSLESRARREVELFAILRLSSSVCKQALFGIFGQE